MTDGDISKETRKGDDVAVDTDEEDELKQTRKLYAKNDKKIRVFESIKI